MQTQKITVEVPAETAKRYETASPIDRRRAERALALALQSRHEAAADLDALKDRMKEQGVAIRLPTSESYELPEPLKVEGKPLSRIIIESRRDR